MTRARATENRHPYKEFEGTELWRALDKGITGLVRNDDLKEQTDRAHIVGYLCKVISSRQKKLLSLTQRNPHEAK